MRRRSVLAGVAGVAVAAAGPQGLASYRGRRRVVLVFASPSDPRLAEQRRALARLGAGGDERDVALVVVAGARVTPPVGRAVDLRRRFDAADTAFVALLIGKDGGVKLRRTGVLDAGLLVKTIDAMPMRRAEVRDRPHR